MMKCIRGQLVNILIAVTVMSWSGWKMMELLSMQAHTFMLLK